MIPSGQRDRLVTFERLSSVGDDYGADVEGVPVAIARAWAKVLFGSGQERREAAQERASMTATFLCNWTPRLATVEAKSRINGIGQIWDIISIAPVGVNDELHFTAVTSS